MLPRSHLLTTRIQWTVLGCITDGACYARGVSQHHINTILTRIQIAWRIPALRNILHMRYTCIQHRISALRWAFFQIQSYRSLREGKLQHTMSTTDCENKCNASICEGGNVTNILKENEVAQKEERWSMPLLWCVLPAGGDQLHSCGRLLLLYYIASYATTATSITLGSSAIHRKGFGGFKHIGPNSLVEVQ